MLMMIVAVVIGVLIAVVILQNPEIIGLLLRFVLIGAVVVVGLVLVAWLLFTIWPSSSKTSTSASQSSAVQGIKFDDQVINLALKAAPVINQECTQKVYKKDTGLQVQVADKNYLVLESSCTPEHANQHFSFVNLVEVSPSSGLKVTDSIKSPGVVNSIGMVSGLVTIDSVEYGPTDPHCCPTVKTIKKYQIKSDKLFIQ